MLVDLKPSHPNKKSWTKHHRRDIHYNAKIIFDFLESNKISNNLTYSRIKEFLFKRSNLYKYINHESK